MTSKQRLVHLVAFAFFAAAPLAYAQTTPDDGYTCLTEDVGLESSAGIAFAKETRAILVLVRFKDDDHGECNRWWCDVPQ